MAILYSKIFKPDSDIYRSIPSDLSVEKKNGGDVMAALVLRRRLFLCICSSFTMK